MPPVDEATLPGSLLPRFVETPQEQALGGAAAASAAAPHHAAGHGRSRPTSTPASASMDSRRSSGWRRSPAPRRLRRAPMPESGTPARPYVCSCIRVPGIMAIHGTVHGHLVRYMLPLLPLSVTGKVWSIIRLMSEYVAGFLDSMVTVAFPGGVTLILRTISVFGFAFFNAQHSAGRRESISENNCCSLRIGVV